MRIFGTIILLMLVFVTSSCANNKRDKVTNYSTLNIPQTTSLSSSSSPSPNSTPSPSPSQASINLDTIEAVRLRNVAFEHYVNVKQGGSICLNNELNTPVNNEGYYYFCSDLDSIDKLELYLNKVFIEQVTKQILESLNVKKINNKLAYQQADGGSMNDWAKATVKLINKEKNTCSYEFLVPTADGAKSQIILVNYIYIENAGWRVGTTPGKLK
ncbi:IseA DL-endopeptidase inhibitor family protein, partial [Paenibacillus koleovorans]|uniref:IseA DL-endopeptidase inhibitor family protein n=1 Tax=Paenibacillus koleovorans TaxID=121608 RepID=UPI001C3F645C